MAWLPGMASHGMSVDVQGRRWLELMRAHHVGGVAMAEAAPGHASSAKVLRLAAQPAAAQTLEITQYDQLLSGPYA